MNILIMTNMFPPIRTGSSHYAVDLANIFQNSGHSVTIVTVKLKNNNPDDDMKYPFQIIRLPNIHFSFKKLFAFFTITSLNMFNYFKLAQIIKKNKIQIIHQVSHYLDTAILTRIVGKITQTPYVVSIHTQLDFENKPYKSFLTWIDRMICGNFILKSANKVISLDTEILRYMNETYKKKWIEKKNIIIPHGIKIDNSNDSSKKDYTLSKLIISVGHVINLRNRFNLIRAVKIVKEVFPDVRLEIIGRIYYSKTQELIDELDLGKNVILCGELQHSTTIQRIRQADIHAIWLNKKYVGMGTAVSESMLLGVPVMNNSPENLLGDRKLENMGNIVLINDNEIREIASKIIFLLRNKDVRKRIGGNSIRFIKENMDLAVIKDQILNVYRDCINE